MMDDLKDAEMLLDWSEKVAEENSEISKYLFDAAKVRIENDYPITAKHFRSYCAQDKNCAHTAEIVMETLDSWHDGLVAHLKR